LSSTVVELEGVNGEWFNLTTGDRGVYLATDVKGAFYDPPVKCVYEEPGNYPGARYLNHRVLRRDIVFGVEILNDKGAGSWLSRDSEWRKAWAFDADCKLHVTTPESGSRYLKLRLFESPDVDMYTDPNGNRINRTVMTCVAGDPFWYEDDVVYTVTTSTDTRFNPAVLPWPWPQPSLPVENLTVTVDPSDGRGGLNPTDNYIFPVWTVPGSTEAPSKPYVPGLPWLGAPTSKATIWTLPDYSFEDPDHATRRVRLPGLIGGLRTEEVQCFNLDGRLSGGNFKLKHGSEWTGSIPWNASPGVVKSSLEALAAIAYDDIEVTRGKSTNEVQIIELEGGPTGGTFTLSFAGHTTLPIPYNASNLDIYGKLQALPSLGAFEVGVKSKVTNEVQVIKLVGEPREGTFTLTFDGQTTNPIQWNCSPIQLQFILAELTGIDLTDISVTQDIFTPYAPWTVRFDGFVAPKYPGINLQQMTGDPEGLEGGAGMDVIVSTETQGSRPYVVTFRGNRSGQNVPEMTANSSGLTGGVSPTVKIRTDVPGSYPYIVKYRNALAGQSFPLLQVDVSGLSGSDLGSRVWKTVEGYTAPAENCVIDTDPRAEQIVSESGSAVWSRMNGVRFRHPIPPWTKSKTFQISVSGCAPGQMVTLRLPRPWSRCWGLE
jgi:hypothetical protein